MKKQSELGKIYKYIYYNYFNGYNTSPNNLVVVREGEHYNIVVEETPYYEFEKNPEVFINDRDGFDRLVDEVYNTKVMEFDDTRISLNPFQSIYIAPNGVKMSGDFKSIKKGYFFRLEYLPSSDTINVLSNFKDNNKLVYDFLSTEISSELIPANYRDIIDRSYYKYNDLNYYEYLSTTNAEYDIDVTLDEVVLTKKRNLRFYER